MRYNLRNIDENNLDRDINRIFICNIKYCHLWKHRKIISPKFIVLNVILYLSLEKNSTNIYQIIL